MNRLETLKKYADQVLVQASYPGSGTPLLADGVNVTEKAPIREEDGHIVCNVAHQQIFMRFLCGLTELTGDPQYKKRAQDIMQYMMDHPMEGGLMRWGGTSLHRLGNPGRSG